MVNKAPLDIFCNPLSIKVFFMVAVESSNSNKQGYHDKR